MSTISKAAIKHFFCEHCAAIKGRPCTTSSGLPARYPHSVRMDEARLIYLAGYEEAERHYATALVKAADYMALLNIVANAKRTLAYYRQHKETP